MPHKDPEVRKRFAREWYHKHKDRISHKCRLRYNSVKAHARHIKYKYGITKEQYDSLFINQKGRCAICEKIPDGKIRLHVDHNHETGQVRGLLCYTCNVSLERFVKYRNQIDTYMKLWGDKR